MSRSRDAIGISFGKHFPNRFPNRVTSARLRRKENSVRWVKHDGQWFVSAVKFFRPARFSIARRQFQCV
jgi:hypothetical protein